MSFTQLKHFGVSQCPDMSLRASKKSILTVSSPSPYQGEVCSSRTKGRPGRNAEASQTTTPILTSLKGQDQLVWHHLKGRLDPPPPVSLSQKMITLPNGLILLGLATRRAASEAQKPSWHCGIAIRKVFARPESFCA